MPPATNPFRTGQRVAVTQQIAKRDGAWTTRVEGAVIRFEQEKTGAWFAGSKDDRLWLDRLTLRKDDGEVVACILDQYTHVRVLASPDATDSAGDAADAAATQKQGADD